MLPLLWNELPNIPITAAIDFIPATQLKTIVLKDISLEEFDVDTDNFYIDVHVE